MPPAIPFPDQHALDAARQRRLRAAEQAASRSASYLGARLGDRNRLAESLRAAHADGEHHGYRLGYVAGWHFGLMCGTLVGAGMVAAGLWISQHWAVIQGWIAPLRGWLP